MRNKLVLFGLILGIPIFALAVAEGLRAHNNSELRDSIRQKYPDADPEKLANFTVRQLCADPRAASEDFCGTDANLALMIKASVGSAGTALVLLFLIYIVGVVSRDSRKLLLLFFRPGLYITSSVLIALILVYAALAVAAIYYGESALIGRIHLKLIVLIGIGAAYGAFVLASNAFRLIKKAEISVLGKSLSRDEAPQLWTTVENLADKLGALRPQNMVVGLDPNFFVTEAETQCLGARLSGRTLYCSLPLCRIMNKDEFCSVIGHELGHFKGLDTKYSERFYPIYRGTASSIASLQAAGGEGAGQLALLPAIAVLSYFFDCFAVAESRISRTRELAADQTGASVTDPRSLASALVKVHAFSGIWSGFQQAATHALEQRKMFVNASKLYAEAVADSDGKEALKDILSTHTPHPTDSHPPLGTRLENLEITLEEISDSALDVKPSIPALTLFGSAESKEEELSAVYQMILAKRHGIDLNEAGEEEHSSDLPQNPTCLHCGSPYDPSEYLQDGTEWRCSACGELLRAKQLESGQQ